MFSNHYGAFSPACGNLAIYLNSCCYFFLKKDGVSKIIGHLTGYGSLRTSNVATKQGERIRQITIKANETHTSYSHTWHDFSATSDFAYAIPCDYLHKY